MVDPLFETDVGAEPVLVDELAFEGGEEALAERIVVTVADRSHGRAHAGMAAAGSEAIELYCDPWSEWWMTSSGRRCPSTRLVRG